MNIVSESEVLSILENRRQSLASELKKVEDALLILKGDSPNNMALKEAGKISKLTPELKTQPGKKFFIPKTYAKSHKWDEKVLFAVSQKERAFKEDIAREICRLEPGLSEKKILNLVSVKLSALLKDGAITAIREGRKYKYTVS